MLFTRKCEPRKQRDIGVGSARKPSRDRVRDRPYPRVRRGQAGDGRHLGPPKRTARHGAPRMRPWRRLGHELTKVSACSGEATEVSEARLIRERMAENATREPGSPAEADGCVVKRPIPQSPSPGKQAMERERGASLEETLGTPEARVLVDEAVGSRSRLERVVRADGARADCRNVTGKAGRVVLSGVARRRARMAEMHLGLRRQAGIPIRWKASRVVPPSSRTRGDSSSVRGDGGTILVSG